MRIRSWVLSDGVVVTRGCDLGDDSVAQGVVSC